MGINRVKGYINQVLVVEEILTDKHIRVQQAPKTFENQLLAELPYSLIYLPQQKTSPKTFVPPLNINSLPHSHKETVSIKQTGLFHLRRRRC